MVALLDVSVLIALLDSEHVSHARTADWFLRHAGRGWATCALTENGFMRIVTGSRYPNPAPIGVAWEALESAISLDSHEFWPCDLSLLDRERFDPGSILGPSQITDAYLLGLATQHRGEFATLDQRISANSAKGAGAANLIVI
jgi:toxin-antitoxin system PIN domain toxin